MLVQSESRLSLLPKQTTREKRGLGFLSAPELIFAEPFALHLKPNNFFSNVLSTNFVQTIYEKQSVS